MGYMAGVRVGEIVFGEVGQTLPRVASLKGIKAF